MATPIVNSEHATFDIAGDFEGAQDELRILNEINMDEISNWSSRDTPAENGRMVERLIVMTNMMRIKIEQLASVNKRLYALSGVKAD